MRLTQYFLIALPLMHLSACAQPDGTPAKEYPYQLSDAAWKDQLSPEAYQVLRQKGTERAFTGKYNDHNGKGMYRCAGCANPLFSSNTKYNSGTGWPSFFDVVSKNNVGRVPDHSHGWVRTEVVCTNCGGHLGHVFDDGPKPTGLRYCINSVSLEFMPDE